MTFRPKALLVSAVFLGLLLLASLKQTALVALAIAAGIALEMLMWRGIFSRR